MSTTKRGPRKGESPTSPRRIEARKREEQALTLRLARMGYAQIASKLGYRSPSGAQQAVVRAMERLPMEPAEELREWELRRLDELERALWPKALKGSAPAVHAIIRCMERRAKYTGLDAPKQIKGSLVVSPSAKAKRMAILALLHPEAAAAAAGE